MDLKKKKIIWSFALFFSFFSLSGLFFIYYYFGSRNEQVNQKEDYLSFVAKFLAVIQKNKARVEEFAKTEAGYFYFLCLFFDLVFNFFAVIIAEISFLMMMQKKTWNQFYYQLVDFDQSELFLAKMVMHRATFLFHSLVTFIIGYLFFYLFGWLFLLISYLWMRLGWLKNYELAAYYIDRKWLQKYYFLTRSFNLFCSLIGILFCAYVVDVRIPLADRIVD